MKMMKKPTKARKRRFAEDRTNIMGTIKALKAAGKYRQGFGTDAPTPAPKPPQPDPKKAAEEHRQRVLNAERRATRYAKMSTGTYADGGAVPFDKDKWVKEAPDRANRIVEMERASAAKEKAMEAAKQKAKPPAKPAKPKGYAHGGAVKGGRGDGCAVRGRTKGKMY